MPKKMFISLPMRGHTVEEIRKRQDFIYEITNKVMEDEYELIDTICTDEPDNPDNQLWYLGGSIRLLGEADLVIFAAGWPRATGCVVERVICDLYGIPRMDERHVIDLLEVKECSLPEVFLQ